MELEQGSSSGKAYNLYTGITNLEVVAFNPTLVELQVFNPNAKQEPVYSQQDMHFADFYLQNVDLNTRVRFILKKSIRKSQTGKTLFINDRGQSVYSESAEYIKTTYPWFSLDGLREAYEGEDELMNFIRAWLSIKVTKPSGLCKFKDREAIFNGNFTELRQTFDLQRLSPKGSIREVRSALMVTTKETENGIKRYQNVFTRHFEQSWMTGFQGWEKKLFNDGSPTYSGDMQDSMDYKLYVAPTETVGETSPAQSSAAALPF
jgi:hypothetical protein